MSEHVMKTMEELEEAMYEGWKHPEGLTRSVIDAWVSLAYNLGIARAWQFGKQLPDSVQVALAAADE